MDPIDDLVNRIEEDINDRMGIEWSSCQAEVQEEIREALREIIDGWVSDYNIRPECNTDD